MSRKKIAKYRRARAVRKYRHRAPTARRTTGSQLVRNLSGQNAASKSKPVRTKQKNLYVTPPSCHLMVEAIESLRRLKTSLMMDYKDLGSILGVDEESARCWEQGLSQIPTEQRTRLSELDAALAQLSSFFLPDRLPEVIRRNAELFDGERAYDWILRGRLSEVVERYDNLLRYQGD